MRLQEIDELFNKIIGLYKQDIEKDFGINIARKCYRIWKELVDDKLRFSHEFEFIAKVLIIIMGVDLLYYTKISK